MKHRKVDILFLIGLLFITAALSLTGYNIWKGIQGSISANEVLYQLELGSGSEEYLTTPGKEMPGFNLDGVVYAGVLQIPELGLQLPVADYWDDAVSEAVPCRYTGSPYTGDLIIAGHNYRQHFGRLHSLYPGAEVYFTDIDGNSFIYSVISMETIDGFDVTGMKDGSGTDLLENSKDMDCWDLTLFTCNFSGQARIAVRCVEI